MYYFILPNLLLDLRNATSTLGTYQADFLIRQLMNYYFNILHPNIILIAVLYASTDSELLGDRC